MNLKEYFCLCRIKKQSSPCRCFKHDLKNDLNLIWQERYGRPKVNLARRWSIVALSLVIIFGPLSTGVYAYASPGVTSGNPLYKVKKGLEKVEGRTKITPEARANFYLKKIARREAEKKVLISRQENIDGVDYQIKAVEHSLGDLDKKIKDPKTSEKVKKQLEKRKANMEIKEEKLEKQEKNRAESQNENSNLQTEIEE